MAKEVCNYCYGLKKARCPRCWGEKTMSDGGECPYCKGSGHTGQTCPNCNGTGEKERKYGKGDRSF